MVFKLQRRITRLFVHQKVKGSETIDKISVQTENNASDMMMPNGTSGQSANGYERSSSNPIPFSANAAARHWRACALSSFVQSDHFGILSADFDLLSLLTSRGRDGSWRICNEATRAEA
jgi:hypothetical protein